MKKMVVALGGNAILQRHEKGTAEEQQENVRKTAGHIAGFVRAGYRVAVTHGNGPQVGNILIQNEAGSGKVPPMPMDICGAQSQGMIGYMMQMYLRQSLGDLGLNASPVTILTQVFVDEDDPAFTSPSKPVGPFCDETRAREREKNFGEKWIEDSGRGWRRVVPSPDPKEIIEADAIKALIERGYVVISTGGGGIPVIRARGRLRGIEAVIDKDLGAERLATAINADILLILTDVDGAALSYGTPGEKWLRQVSLSEIKDYDKQGHFKKGSMGPKVRAMIRFLEHGGRLGIIASLDKASLALQGQGGTVFVPDDSQSGYLQSVVGMPLSLAK